MYSIWKRYSHDERDISYVDCMSMMRYVDVVPRIVNYRQFYHMYTKYVIIYLKSMNIDALDTSGVAISTYASHLLSTVVSHTVLMMIDRCIFIQLLMSISITIDYNHMIYHIDDKVRLIDTDNIIHRVYTIV